MNEIHDRAQPDGTPRHSAWGAVASVTLGVFSLVTAEFLPASLLTPIAGDIGISEGAAGQAVTVTAFAALTTGLLVSAAIRNIDRRHVLIAFTLLLIASNLLVALAPGFSLLLVGRVLLGVAIGGFWTMSAAVIMRLVPENRVPRALSIMFAGVSAATVVAAPVGSYMGDIFGWRAVFLLCAAMGVVTLFAQISTLPKMPPRGAARLRTLFDVLARPGVAFGMLASLLVFAGHFAFFTYIRALLEEHGAGISEISAILLGFGLANFLGTFMAGFLIERSLRMTLATMPLLMASLSLMLIYLAGDFMISAALIAVWGFAFGAVPVAWSTWLTRTVPDQAESAGGLLVAGIQLAIALGAAAGGLIFDRTGGPGVYLASAIILVTASLIVMGGIRLRAPAPA